MNAMSLSTYMSLCRDLYHKHNLRHIDIFAFIPNTPYMYAAGTQWAKPSNRGVASKDNNGDWRNNAIMTSYLENTLQTRCKVTYCPLYPRFVQWDGSLSDILATGHA